MDSINHTAVAVAKGSKHFEETLGNIPPTIAAMMKHVPEIFAGYLEFREAIYQGKHLDMKTKELLYTVLDIVTGNLDGAKNHGQAGLKSGMTSGQVAEACMIITHVCGITPYGTVGHKVVDYLAAIEEGRLTE